jgi:hypothetical protein
VLCAVALLAGACSRDLALPARSTLAAVDPFPSAAPYEQLTLSVTGGARPYHFEFAPGGNASGGTVDANTGVYTAGPTGPSIDLVICRDAAGAIVQARIGVGSPLQVSPTSAFVAPGGRASFIPTGGKAPYLLEVVGGAAPGAIAGTAFDAAPSGGCAGAVSPPATVALRLTDATSAPPIDLTVTVGRGLDLFPAAGTGAVAPYEQIAFVASGGQPPYQFSLAQASSAGCSVDAGRGTYVAGRTGNAVDVVMVTDAIGQERCFSVDVGPELAVTLTPNDARPGKTMRLVASGGRPPYAFSFAPKGNRSRATLDDVSGIYVPGQNALATDLLMVSDATGAPPLGPIAVKVGPVEVVTGDGNWGCWAAPVNADATPDVLLAGYYSSIKTVLMSRTGALPAVAEYPMSLTAQPVAVDLDRDGYMDLAYVDGNGYLKTLMAQAGGALVDGPQAALADSAYGHGLAVGGTGRIFAIASFDPTCNPSSTGTAVIGLDYDAAARTFKAPVCVAPPRNPMITGLAAGDFDGDGRDDIAYGANQGGGTTIWYRLAREGFAIEHAVPLPAPWHAQIFNGQEVSPWLAVRPAGAPYTDLVVVVLDAPNGGTFDTGLAVLTGGPTGLTLKQTRLTVPGGYNIMSISPIGMGSGGRPQIVAANVTNGTMEIFDYVRTSPTPLADAPVQLPERSFRVGSVCAADFDGDGIQDLFLAPRNGYGASGELLAGEGDGTYARRPRFAIQSSIQYPGDVDGDGLVDFLEPTVGGLQVLFASDGELALGPETPIDGQFLAVRVGDWDLDGVPDLMIRAGAAGVQLLRGLPARDGHFAPAVPVATADPLGVPTSYAAAFIVGGHFQLPPGPSMPRPLDLVGIERVGSVFREVALIFRDATHATVAYPPGAEYDIPLAFDADGDGVDDLADARSSSGTLQLSLVKPGDPLPPANPSWPFRAWATASTHWPDVAAGVVPVPGQNRSRGVFVGAYGFTLVEAPGGAVGAVEIAIDPSLLTTLASAWTYDARVAFVDGDAYPDLVVARPPPYTWLVFRGNAQGTFSATPDPALSFQPGFANLYPGFTFQPVPGPTGQDDLVVIAGPTTVVILHNDGAGRYR